MFSRPVYAVHDMSLHLCLFSSYINAWDRHREGSFPVNPIKVSNALEDGKNLTV